MIHGIHGCSWHLWPSVESVAVLPLSMPFLQRPGKFPSGLKEGVADPFDMGERHRFAVPSAPCFTEKASDVGVAGL